jgi:hypothetical protein
MSAEELTKNKGFKIDDFRIVIDDFEKKALLAYYRLFYI